MSISTYRKQSGVTLITTLILLVVMTVFGVSAIKLSLINALIAGNDQQEMLLSQEAQTQLNDFARIINLSNTYSATGFQSRGSNVDKYIFDQTNIDGIKTDKTITNMNYNYTCKRRGLASSLGSDAPNCDLFDFFVELKSSHSSAKKSRHEGAGKMLPKSIHSSDSTKGVYNLVD